MRCGANKKGQSLTKRGDEPRARSNLSSFTEKWLHCSASRFTFINSTGEILTNIILKELGYFYWMFKYANDATSN